MTASTLTRETFVPTVADAGTARMILASVRSHEHDAPAAAAETGYSLSGPGPDDIIPLTPEIFAVLKKVAEAMDDGLAVTVTPETTTLTTQQAADLLGVSRPTLIRLLAGGALPYERVGSHRRLQLRDLLDYREKRRQEQYDALAATSVELEEEEGLEAMLERLREARRAVGRRYGHR
ncbi:helix-turn-helix domain-containing protein [Sinomonas halotolerans]|uniref:Helix-turn-helix domain-containing protein n=1 Tax=Sinomonas halotolerans TaxID=1644133 RepID=A0ABU9X2F9_9MICC